MVDRGVRYANIGIAVSVLIVAAGVLLFRNSSEAAMQATAMIGFIVGLGVYRYLDERAQRPRSKRR